MSARNNKKIKPRPRKKSKPLSKHAYGAKFSKADRKKPGKSRASGAALLQSEEKYRTLFLNAPDSIVIMDLDLKVLDANGQFGIPPAEIVGKNWLVFFNVTEEDREFSVQLKKRLLKGEKVGPAQRKYPILGKETWVEFHPALIKKDGKPWGFQVIARNITERKQADDALRASEEKYRTLFESAPESINIVGLDGTILETNTFFGRSRDEVIGKKFQEMGIVPAEYLSKANEFLPKIFKGEKISPIEIKILNNKKQERWVENHISLVRKDGKPYALQVISMDITERKRLEEQLQQAQKMEAIGRLAGGVAHDFNNQLAVIMNASELIKGTFDKNDPRTEHFNMILSAADQAASLTKQLLAFSRKQIVEPVVLDLNLVAANLEKMLSRLIGEDINLQIALEPEPVYTKVDRVQIEQVIFNLAVNARDAMPEGGTLKIETAKTFLDEEYARSRFSIAPGFYVMLSVSDSGMGMDRETLSHVFEPFFTTKEIGKGTGLGLATVYGIIKQSGGDISVYSEPSTGTTFRIYLPMIMPKGQSRAGGREVVDETMKGSATVMVVEDNEQVRRMIVAILKNHGYRVRDCPSAGPALEEFGQHEGSIDMVITDVVMPGMGVKEFINRVLETRPETKVLYISGYPDEIISHHNILEPGTNFLQKPFSTRSLLKKVREVLGTG